MGIEIDLFLNFHAAILLPASYVVNENNKITKTSSRSRNVACETISRPAFALRTLYYRLQSIGSALIAPEYFHYVFFADLPLLSA